MISQAKTLSVGFQQEVCSYIDMHPVKSLQVGLEF